MWHPCHSWAKGGGRPGEEQYQKQPFKTRGIPCCDASVFCQIPSRAQECLCCNQDPVAPVWPACKGSLPHREKGSLGLTKVHPYAAPTVAHLFFLQDLLTLEDFVLSLFRNTRSIVSSSLPFVTLRFSLLPCTTHALLWSIFPPKF